MTPLLGRPVMEHIIGLLKRHGIGDICVTLCYKPQGVMDHFGDGDRLGVRLTWYTEDEPLGTAGSVKRCMDRLGEEDFLVIGGDCVCDLDLSQLIRFHRERGAQATLGLYRHDSPLEYGLVLTDREGRVERFVEKPGWGQVFTDRSTPGSMCSPPPPWSGSPKTSLGILARTCSPPSSGRGPRSTACPWRATGGTWETAGLIWTAPATSCPARWLWTWACPSGREGSGPPRLCPLGSIWCPPAGSARGPIWARAV